MTSKTFTKVVVAFGLLAIVLIFLGVNYVPRISAFSAANENTINANLIENVSEARAQAQGEANLTVSINKSSGSLVGQIQSPDSMAGDEPYLSPWLTTSGQIQSPDSTPGDVPYLSPLSITSGQIQSPDSTPGDVPYLSPLSITSGQIQSPDSTPGDEPYP